MHVLRQTDDSQIVSEEHWRWMRISTPTDAGEEILDTVLSQPSTHQKVVCAIADKIAVQVQYCCRG